MIMLEVLMNVRSLAKQGYTLRAIARMMGMHRKTVKKHLDEKVLPVYHQISRTSKLEPFKGLIENWLGQQNYQATRIYELLLAQGFRGSYSIVKRFVGKVKERRDRVAYVRFETLPGQQAQVDFGDFAIECADGTKLTIYCFIMVLGFSRRMYVEFIDRCTLSKFLGCHIRAFEFFGGILSEILYDNMKNVVIKKLAGAVQWNVHFMQFCTHYGFKPLTTPAYSPWAKGKVERPINYIRERFWRGYAFNNINEANKNILEWLKTIADERVHGTTHEKVADRFEKERSFLGLLTADVYDISDKCYRKVYKDCQIPFDGNQYVVPHDYVGKTVLLKNKDGQLRIFYDEKQILVYDIPVFKGQTIGRELYELLKKDKDQLRRKYRKPFSKKAWATRGLVTGRLGIEVIRRPLSVYDHAIKEVPNA